MNSGSSLKHTPVTSNPKKRELTSPDFDIENKKNRILSDSSDTTDNTESVTLTQTSDSTMSADPSEAMDAHATPAPSTTITIPPAEMLKLSELLKDTFRSEIVGLVDNIVHGVITGLRERITTLESSNKNLQDANDKLTARVAALEAQADQAEQYSRRNCLRISGIPETTGENTDNIVLSIANDIDSEVRLQDIDRSHRVGNLNKKRSKPREIIVKFSTYRARANFYQQRTLMKERGHEGTFINEDITKKRSEYLYEARKLFKSNKLKGCWSSDGTILVKDNDDKVHRITSLNDLVAFGYVPPEPKTAAPSGTAAPTAGTSSSGGD